MANLNGRPKKEVDWKKADELLLSGCTGTEVAAYFGIHSDTFYKKVEEKYKMTFSAYLQEKRSKGESILRAHQFAKAIGLTDKGDNTLLIWLGKTRLKQIEEKPTEEKPTQVVFKVNYANDNGDKVEILPEKISNENTKNPK